VPYRDGPLEDLKVPLTFTAGAALIVAALVATFLLLGDRRETLGPEAWGSAREQFDGVIAPAGTVISAPVRWVGGGFRSVGDYFFAVRENRRLKQRVKELERWRDVAVALKDVNERYETLMRLRTQPEVPWVAAHVILDSRGPFSNARLANSGSENGVRVGHPVMSEHGIVGRIVGVTRGASRVLLLTDAQSRTPVMIDRTNGRAILTGDGGPNPRLEYLRGVDPVKQGDTILTSGDGGVFPRGLPVGTAVRGLDGVWRARLYSDRGPIDYVRILLFDNFAQITNPAALAVTTVPPVALPPGAVQPGAAQPGAAQPGAAPATAPPTPAPARPAAAPARPAAAAPTPRPAAAPRPAPARTATPAPPRPAPAPAYRVGPIPAAPTPAAAPPAAGPQ
jgi:rod shape-determining protein MreC